METVEAVQAFLPGLGWVLIPADEGFAPMYVLDEWLYYEQPRIFEKPNEAGPMYKYARSEQAKRYTLIGPT